MTPPSLGQRNTEEAEKGGIPPSERGTAADSMGEQGALMEAGVHPWAFTEGGEGGGMPSPVPGASLCVWGPQGSGHWK